jgi:AcrR family transcriptional regulator
MVKKTMGELRATFPTEKEARRRRMLTAAAQLLESWSYRDITMERIADRAGVAKGTLYLYFRTRESLFLGLYQEKLISWYRELEALAGLGSHTIEASEAARVIASTLSAHPTLVHLHGILQSELYGNIDLQATLEFRRRQRTRMASLSSALARRVRDLTEEHALLFLIRLEAVVGGISWSANPSPALERAFDDPELADFLVDFEDELREIATALLK